MLYDVVIVGAGFAGTLLGRILARNGWRTLIVDRQHHPRFALGESTTPLANLALERMARRHDLPDLAALAAHGRWKAKYPQLRCGLKRGFSFYHHQPGRHFDSDARNEGRLLVAASPDDEIADTHWLRADVDHLFAALAVDDGADLVEGVELESIAGEPGRWRPGFRGEEPLDGIEARLLVDASGPASAVARSLGAGDGPPLRTSSALLFGHFRGVGGLDAMITAAGRAQAPYPEERAAVHHLLEEGWMYSLRFDDGRVSAGILIDTSSAASDAAITGADDASRRWNEIIGRYPSLEKIFAPAEAVRGIGARSRVQHRLDRACGPGWVALPHSMGFVDPLFSIGIAWSLRGVERLADLLAARSPRDEAVASGEVFSRYGILLERELEQIDRLIAPAYKGRRDFELFVGQALLYFAVVSFSEARERLCDVPEPWWDGFLGAADRQREALFEESARRLEAALADGTLRAGLRDWLGRSLAAIDVAGLDDPPHPNIYPVDLAVLVERSAKLGLDRRQIEAALPRLRGRPGAGGHPAIP